LEALKILRKWASHIAPEQLRRREAVYHTLIGVEAIATQGRYAAGIREILTEGSVPYLLRGIVSNAYRRWVRRQRPTS
jgi:hypothetical protein